MSDDETEGEYTGTLETQLGSVTQVTYEPHELVAILEGAGVQLTPSGDQSGEAYA